MKKKKLKYEKNPKQAYVGNLCIKKSTDAPPHGQLPKSESPDCYSIILDVERESGVSFRGTVCLFTDQGNQRAQSTFPQTVIAAKARMKQTSPLSSMTHKKAF